MALEKEGNTEFWINKKGEPVHKDLVGADEQLKDELVEKLCIEATEVSDFIADFKQGAFTSVEEYFSLLLQKYKRDYKKNSKKGNLTIENFSGTAKIEIAVADSIAFDEKLNIAKEIIDEFLVEETKDASPTVKTLITKAFEVDKKGTLSPKKILALKTYDIENNKWQQAMKIIDEAIDIVSSKNYIRFYKREKQEAKYEMIPLNIAGV